MATANNIQEDEPRTTTLERQVQTLAANVERLTKQNHDLKVQLCQKNVGLNTQEEGQEDTHIERRDQEGPKGSNAPKKTRMIGHEPAIRHRYGTTSHSRRVANDEGMDGLYDERP